MMMCWNCRGMGFPSAIQQLKGLAREINPDIICLVETLVKEEKIKKLQKSLGFCNGVIVNPIGRSGGIAVLYKDGITMEPLHASNHIISGSQVLEQLLLETVKERFKEDVQSLSMHTGWKKQRPKLLNLDFSWRGNKNGEI
ncbi:hypothetical protein ACHQM5_005333 [Ranunculus cassubicifolius]